VSSMFTADLKCLVLCALVVTTSAVYKRRSRHGRLLDKLTRENEVEADEVFDPEEVEVTELASADEVDAQLIKELEEIISMQDVGNVEELENIQEVVKKQPVSKLTPLKSAKEVEVQEVLKKTYIPEAVAKKFLRWRAKKNKSKYSKGLAEDYTIPVYLEKEETEPNVDKYNSNIKIIDKQIVEKIEQIKKLEKVVSKLKIKKMEEVERLEEIRGIEEVKRAEEITKIDEVVNKEEVTSVKEVVNKEEVISKQPIKTMEEIISMEELTDNEVKKLYKMLTPGYGKKKAIKYY